MRELKTISNKNALVDYSSSDDAAVYNLNGHTVLQTVDFFTPIVDDAYDFGRISAANSLSDIYAMGGTPLFALNIVAFPSDNLPISVLSDILRGGADVSKEAGIPILGGHSIRDDEPKFGMVVTGIVKESYISNAGAMDEDILILTKPLGTGIISTAIKKGKADQSIIEHAIQNMSTLNKNASKAMMDIGINACTDVTGYGLLGHLLEMCKASGKSAVIESNAVKYIDGTKELGKQGFIPGGTKKNLDYIKKSIRFDSNITRIEQYMLSDAQTSGGLLISVPPQKADLLNDKLLEVGCNSQIIGKIIGTNESIKIRVR